ncbi:MAG: DUF1552 domain-containing protein, partial [Verrucomicrobiota bacterium]
MKRSRRISRRHLLRGLGGALALPWLEVMGEGERIPPKRLSICFQPNGVLPAAWDCPVQANGEWSLSPILEPLLPFKDSLMPIHGVDSLGTGHVGLTSSFLTGTELRRGACAASLDQVVAKEVGRGTRLPFLCLGTEPPRQGMDGGQPISWSHTVSWKNEHERISPELHPRTVFDRLMQRPEDPRYRSKIEGRKSILDQVQEDTRALKKRVSYRDQETLDQFLQSVRELELELESSLRPSPSRWKPEALPDLVPPPSQIPKDRATHLRLLMDVTVLAFQMDITRVSTLMMAHGFSRQTFPFLEGIRSDHHTMAPYFTVYALGSDQGDGEAMLDRWCQIKLAANQAVTDFGGTVTH